MMKQSTETALIEAIKKIPLLSGLSPSRVRAMLHLCAGRAVAEGTQLCSTGGTSDEMYILLGGELGIFTADGLQVAAIKPVQALGIGAITGQPRLAAVRALKPSKILVIHQPQLDHFLREDKPSCSRIYRNFISILADKVTNDNVRLRDFQLERERFEGRLAILQRQFRAHQQRTHFILEYLAQKGHLDYGEARQRLDAQRPASRLLVASAAAQLRQQLKEALPGSEVAEAHSGPEALAAVKAGLPDLVIAELRLPQMDGPELLQRLREYHPALPVLAIAAPEEAAGAQEKGFDGVVDKPLQAEALQAVVGGLLAKEGF